MYFVFAMSWDLTLEVNTDAPANVNVFPSGSPLEILCLARAHLPHRVRCPQTAYCCLARAEWACECLTSDLSIKASVK
jgi:hypothetical protein